MSPLIYLLWILLVATFAGVLVAGWRFLRDQANEPDPIAVLPTPSKLQTTNPLNPEDEVWFPIDTQYLQRSQKADYARLTVLRCCYDSADWNLVSLQNAKPSPDMADVTDEHRFFDRLDALFEWAQLSSEA